MNKQAYSAQSAARRKPALVKLDRRTIAPILSLDFGVQLLSKESELESSPSIEVVQELVNLYSQAIEYYEHKNDPKFYDFEEKLHKMLVKPEVIDLMQPSTSSTKNRRNSPSKQKSKNLIKNQAKLRSSMVETLSSELSSSLLNLSEKGSKNLIRIIATFNERSKEISEKAKIDFSMQDTDLQRRLASRKKLMLHRSQLTASLNSSNLSRVSTTNNSGIFSSLKGEDSTRSSFANIFDGDFECSIKAEEFEKGLEEIMEKLCSEQAMKMTEIKINYKIQIKTLEEAGSIRKARRAEIKEKANQEILNIAKEFKLKRKQEIQSLKEKNSN
eukprot:CAMPEP_0202944686 /NCGR_PEP_ID=MMETSP1395-20130829/5557_1 /ASSEMBLY_ACC=CAM_ASM_000871 /TAXON_ID=5961 /ORGANISM="Blepharisma japonicum, Strain Stock R1072" /LENGTH=328 /DNA_ID=CAMNT_0049643815 /DNA_START=14 /DNA_END=1000 /DNA_ORIENTATION=-